MSRYAVAITLSSWHEDQRGKRRRRKKKGGGGNAGGGRPSGSRSRGGRQGSPRTGGGRRSEERQRGAPAEPRLPANLEEARSLPPSRGGARRGRDALRGEEEELGHEAELSDAELDEALGDEGSEDDDLGDEDQDLGDDDLGEDKPRGQRRRERGKRREAGEGRRGLGARVRDAVTRDWQKPQALGPGMRIQTKRGLRAAIVEVKPGLFVVAEVPAESVEFGFGPMLLAPALMKTLGRALQGRRSAGRAGRAHRPELSTESEPKQLPGPTEDQPPETEGLARWLDDDIAAEIGCPACVRRDRRKP